RKSDGFVVETSEGDFHAPCLVVAAGGLSIPKIGATSFGYDLARQFGVKIRDCRPALEPLTFDSEDRQQYCDLAGISAAVVASCDSQRFQDKMLITHRGLSGPAILQISSYWQEPKPITIDLAPAHDVTAPLRTSSARRDLSAARASFSDVLPDRLSDRLVQG